MLVRPEVLTQPVYEPGRPIEDVARQFGFSPTEVLKLASNENPLGPSPRGIAAAQAALAEAHLYPDGGTVRLRERLASYWELSPDQFLVGNGSNEVMVLLAQALLGPGDEAVMGAHAFIAFRLGVLMAGATPISVPMPELRHDLGAMRAAVTDRTKVVYLPNPNNPTGDFTPGEEVLAFAKSLPERVVFLYDEAYAEYLDDAPDLRPLIAEGRAVACCRTFSKIYGLAAMRIGYLYGPAGLVRQLHRLRQPFNVNAIAQAAATAALDDSAFAEQSRQVNAAGMRQVTAGLDALGITWVPSAGNFLLVETEDPSGRFMALQKRGIITRPVAGYGLPRHLRISIGTSEQNERLLTQLSTLAATATTA